MPQLSSLPEYSSIPKISAVTRPRHGARGYGVGCRERSSPWHGIECSCASLARNDTRSTGSALKVTASNVEGCSPGNRFSA